MKIDRNNPLGGSMLNRAILQVNPGVDRRAECLIRNLSKLSLKTSRASECRRREFVETFEMRRNYPEKLYERLRPELDPSVTVAIDRIKEGQKMNGWGKIRKTKSDTTVGLSCTGNQTMG